MTPREREVLELVARGLANRQIADELAISEHTAKAHVERLLVKTGARNRTHLATLALSDGMVGE